MINKADEVRDFHRLSLRAAFQSLFWHVLSVRKREAGLSLKWLADRLGVNKSYVSRSFSSPPNWQIDKIADIADALGVDLVIEARDRADGRVYTPHGNTAPMQHTTLTESKASGYISNSTYLRVASPKPILMVGSS